MVVKKGSYDVRERLARIETSQRNISDQLNYMLKKQDVQTEIGAGLLEIKNTQDAVLARLKAVERELDTWKPAKHILLWLAGVAALVIGTLSAFLLAKPNDV